VSVLFGADIEITTSECGDYSCRKAEMHSHRMYSNRVVMYPFEVVERVESKAPTQPPDRAASRLATTIEH
jgi:hypothetical protein